MNKNISQFIEDNWEELKQKALSQWDKLNEDELDNIAESPQQLIEKIKTAYQLETNQAEKEITDFLSDNGFENSVVANTEKKATEVKDKLCTYVKENPVKSLGIAAISGFLLAKIIF